MSAANKGRHLFAATGLILLLAGMFLVVTAGSVSGVGLCTVSMSLTVYVTSNGVGLQNAQVSITGPTSSNGLTDNTGHIVFYLPCAATGTYTVHVNPNAAGCSTPADQSQYVSGDTTFLFTVTGCSGGGTPFTYGIGYSGYTSVQQGNSISLTWTISLLTGTSQAVTLTTSGCPTNVNCSWDTNVGTPTSGNPFIAHLTIQALSSATTGSYNVVVTSTSTGTTPIQTAFTLTVTGSTAPFDFSLTQTGGTTSGLAGNTLQMGLAIATTSGNPQTVSLTAIGCPTSATCGFNLASATPFFNSVFNAATTTNTPASSYGITVTGTGGGKTHSTTFTFTVTSPPAFDFTVSAGGQSSVQQGQSTTISVYVTLQSGTTQSVNLSLYSSCPSNAQCSSLNSGNPSFTSIFTFIPSTNTPIGTYTFTFMGQGGGKTHFNTDNNQNPFSITVTAQPPPPQTFDFSMSTPSAVSVSYPGSPATTTVTLTLTPGVSGTATVNMAVNGCPGGMTCTANPNSGQPTFTTTITFTPTASTPAGTYNIQVSGVGGGQTHTATFQLTVTTAQFDFSFGSASSSPTISQGNSVSVSLPVNLVSGTTQSVALTVSCPSAVATCTITSSGSPTFTASVTINVQSGAAGGNYYATITGTSTSHLYQTQIGFTVPTVVGFGFSMSASTPNAVIQGSSTSSQITVNLVSGTTQQVSLGLEVNAGCPQNAQCSFTPNTGQPPFTSTLNINTSPSTPVGSYTVKVDAISSGVNAQTVTVSVPVTVDPPTSGCNLANPVVQVSFTDSHGTQQFSDPKGSYTLDPTFHVTANLQQSSCTVTEVDVVFIPWQDSYSQSPPRTPVTPIASSGVNAWSGTFQGTPGGKYFFDVIPVTSLGPSYALSALTIDYTGGNVGTVTFLNIPSGLWGWLTNPFRIFGYVLIIIGLFSMWLGVMPRRY